MQKFSFLVVATIFLSACSSGDSPTEAAAPPVASTEYDGFYRYQSRSPEKGDELYNEIYFAEVRNGKYIQYVGYEYLTLTARVDYSLNFTKHNVAIGSITPAMLQRYRATKTSDSYIRENSRIELVFRDRGDRAKFMMFAPDRKYKDYLGDYVKMTDEERLTMTNTFRETEAKRSVVLESILSRWPGKTFVAINYKPHIADSSLKVDLTKDLAPRDLTGTKMVPNPARVKFNSLYSAVVNEKYPIRVRLKLLKGDDGNYINFEYLEENSILYGSLIQGKLVETPSGFTVDTSWGVWTYQAQ